MKQLYLSLFLVTTFFIQQVSAQPGQGWLDGWTHRKQIEIDHNKVDASLSGFPVAVMLDAGNFEFSLARPDGHDIRFASADGLTELVFERELHDASAQNAVYWVRIPSVDPGANTVFYIYYGNSGAADVANDTGGVWDNNFRAVWHMNQFEEWDYWFIEDSKLANDGEKISENNPLAVISAIGTAQHFETDDFISILPHVSLRFTGGLNLSAWIKPELLPSGYAVVIGQRRSTYSMEIHYDNGEIKIKGYVNNSEITATIEENEYSNVVMTYDGNLQKIYVNGAVISSKTLTGSIATANAYFYIGSDFEGEIDEVRVSNIARSEAWIKADYHSGKGDLLYFDKSGFEIVDPGQQEAGTPFALNLINATSFYDVPLNSSIHVTVTSSITTEGANEDGVLYNGPLGFSNGSATLPDLVLFRAATHTITVSVAGITHEQTIDINVIPAPASKIIFTSPPQTITAGEITQPFTIKVEDNFGNAATKDTPITVTLNSSLAGSFLDEGNDQVTISEVIIQPGGSVAAFRYTTTLAGIHEISIQAVGLTGATQELTVNPGPPSKIVFITAEQIVYTGNLSGVISLQLQDLYDNASFSDASVSIVLSSDKAGTFREEDGSTELIIPVSIAAGETGISFTYLPTETATHVLTASDSDGVLTGDTYNIIVVDLATWKGGYYSENWHAPDNWDPALVPPANSAIIIPSGSPVISVNDVTVRYLNIENGATLTVFAGRSLTIAGDGQVTIEPGGSMTCSGTLVNSAGEEGLVIQSDNSGTGSLIMNSAGVDATVQRWVKGNVWQIVSSPVNGMTVSEFLAENEVMYNSSQQVYAMTHYDETIGTNGGWAGYYTGSENTGISCRQVIPGKKKE
jgi:hypothetical protein